MLSRFLADQRTCIAVLFGVGIYLVLAGAGVHFECLILSWLSIPCPLCGLTRSTLSLLQGDWGMALAYHWFSPLVIVGLLLMLGRSFGSRRTQAIVLSFCRRMDGLCVPQLLVVCLCVYWTARLCGWPWYSSEIE
ncbi:MAG: DUF2752 domain-containing protein [Pirellulaceae bacterium]|nr:DUF2752 domain-containing protein [Pirellulaceae bacterium]